MSTVKELREECRKRNIKGCWKMKKIDLEKAIHMSSQSENKGKQTDFKLLELKTGHRGYRGTATNNYFVMLFLSNSFPNSCIVIPFHPKDKHQKIGRYQLEIIWSVNNPQIKSRKPYLHIPKNFWKILNECNQNPRIRFIMFPLTLEIYKRGHRHGHSNFMIYDKKSNEMERFEPYGDLTMSVKGTQFDKTFQEEIQKHTDIKIKNYYSGNLACPYNKKLRSSYQKIQEKEKKTGKGDPGGFCQAWSLWYAHLRLSNPEIPREDVIQLSLDSLKTKEFTRFIRNYSSFLFNIEKDIEELTPISWKNPNQVFQKYQKLF